MSLQKDPIRILEIDRPIAKEKGRIREIYDNFTAHKFDAAIEFQKDETSEFESIKMRYLFLGNPLFLKDTMPEIFPGCEDREERTEDSPEDFIDFILDNVSREDFIKILSEKFEVDIKLLSKEKGLLERVV